MSTPASAPAPAPAPVAPPPGGAVIMVTSMASAQKSWPPGRRVEVPRDISAAGAKRLLDRGDARELTEDEMAGARPQKK